MISLQGIQAERDNFRLEIENLRIDRGEFVAILGNNGSGKSTFLSLLSGFMKYKGAYQVDGKAADSYDIKAINRKIGLLPQKTSLNMPFDVYYVILTGRFPLTNGYHYEKSDHQHTEKIIRLFDIEHLKHRPFNKLSGGEKQRVLLARALNRHTPILLLDEPLNGIDIRHQHEVINYLKETHDDQTILVVIHDLSLALRAFDRFLLFSEGKLVYDTPKSEINAAVLSDIFGVRIDLVSHDDRLFVHAELNQPIAGK